MTIAEFAIVEIVGDHELAGAVGTVVMVYANGEAYEVEFRAQGDGAFVETVEARYVRDTLANP